MAARLTPLQKRLRKMTDAQLDQYIRDENRADERMMARRPKGVSSTAMTEHSWNSLEGEAEALRREEARS